MGVVEWGVLLALVTFLISAGGVLWKLADRINNSESDAKQAKDRADSAAIAVAANTLRCETVARLLSEHKETIAREYVSHNALHALENRLVDAIGRLGDRIDGLFTRAVPVAPHPQH